VAFGGSAEKAYRMRLVNGRYEVKDVGQSTLSGMAVRPSLAVLGVLATGASVYIAASHMEFFHALVGSQAEVENDDDVSVYDQRLPLMDYEE
jgi:hypothetical protein